MCRKFAAFFKFNGQSIRARRKHASNFAQRKWSGERQPVPQIVLFQIAGHRGKGNQHLN
jgi:hypothetical protein